MKIIWSIQNNKMDQCEFSYAPLGSENMRITWNILDNCKAYLRYENSCAESALLAF